MAFKSKFRDIFYPTGDREPRVAQYRIVLIQRKTTVTAIIHLRRANGGRKLDLSRVEDFDTWLIGSSIRNYVGFGSTRTRLVVQHGEAFVEYPLDFNAADLPVRPAKDKPWQAPVVDVSSRDIVVGSVALFIDAGGGLAAQRWIVDLLG